MTSFRFPSAVLLLSSIASANLTLPANIIDTHVHLSNITFSYPWANLSCGFSCPAAPPCLCEWDYNTYMKASVSLPTTKFVFVEVDVIPSLWLTEAQWVQTLSDDGVPVGAIIAQPPPGFGIPGTDPVTLQVAAQRLMLLSKSRGVRIANVNFSDDSIIDTVISHTTILFQAGLKSFDIIAGGFPLYLGQGNIIKLARALPLSNFIIDHIGNPPYLLDKSHADLWAEAMATIGAEPNIYCKVGGLLQGFKSTKKVPSVDDLRPWIVHSFNSFGFNRSLYEGNWFFANWLVPAELQIYEIFARYITQILLEMGATTEDVENYFLNAATAAYNI
jgi:predicted TIM-barrel fold metal-dependent hydrolase